MNKDQVFELDREIVKFSFQGVAQNRSESTLLVSAEALPAAVRWGADSTGP